MVWSQWIRRRALVGIVGLWAATGAPTAHAAGPASAGQRITDKIGEADGARTDGRLAEAARLYGDAHALIQGSEEYRGTGVALDVVLQAARLYREAFKASARDYALCRESEALLDAFVADLRGRGQAVPSTVSDEQAWVAECLADAPAPAVPVVSEPVQTTPAEPTPDEPSTAPESTVVPPSPEPDDHPDPTDDTEPRGRALPIALVGGGGAAAVTGAVLLAVGLPLRARADDYRSEVLGSPEYLQRGPQDRAAIEAALGSYVDDERRRGVALMASGGAVLGLGVAAVIVGSIQLARARPGRRDRSARARLDPQLVLRPGRLSVGASLRF
ncbi:MAG: hypothetical protein KC501_34495 [Myxococcales bacterium]|nr:hypothetical protein [Myxococcales bacterium]